MNRQEFESQLKAQNTPVVVDFWAPWCGPCQVTTPILRKLAKTYAERVRFMALNADEEAELARSYNVMAIPTVIVFRDGKEIARHIGAKPAQVYGSIFDDLAYNRTPAPAQVAPIDRALRLIAGIALLGLGISQGNWLLAGLGVVLLGLGFYDQLPFFKK